MKTKSFLKIFFTLILSFVLFLSSKSGVFSSTCGWNDANAWVVGSCHNIVCTNNCYLKWGSEFCDAKVYDCSRLTYCRYGDSGCTDYWSFCREEIYSVVKSECGSFTFFGDQNFCGTCAAQKPIPPSPVCNLNCYDLQGKYRCKKDQACVKVDGISYKVCHNPNCPDKADGNCNKNLSTNPKSYTCKTSSGLIK